MNHVLGEPVLIANDSTLFVGVDRAADRTTVNRLRVTSRDGQVTLNVSPAASRPAMSYLSGESGRFGAADDYDGDGRIDRVIWNRNIGEVATILIRVGGRFVDGRPMGEGRLLAEGRVMRFDFGSREWIDDPDQSRPPTTQTRPSTRLADPVR